MRLLIYVKVLIAQSAEMTNQSRNYIINKM
jgi:hypothetical protein